MWQECDSGYNPYLMAKSDRDDFPPKVKLALAQRCAYKCCNPQCRQLTVGPGKQPMQTVLIGVAAHITAAAAGGPRFNQHLAPEQRCDVANGIWLCQNCARLIDRDVDRHPAGVLHEWKEAGENYALEAINGQGGDEEPVDFQDVCRLIVKYLEANEVAFTGYGPNSGALDGGPVRFDLTLWYRARDAIIIPNNSAIARILDSHSEMVPKEAADLVKRFKLHAYAFAEHCKNPKLKYDGHRFPFGFTELVYRYAAQRRK
jgi:hypothetical protein